MADEMLKKSPKTAVLYIHRTGTQYQCKDCIMFIPGDKRCWIHYDDTNIEPYGTCGYFVKGKPQPGLQPLGRMTKLESGYTDESQPGYSCKRCEYFNPPEMKCKRVDETSPGDDPGKIHPDACCSNWDAK